MGGVGDSGGNERVRKEAARLDIPHRSSNGLVSRAVEVDDRHMRRAIGLARPHRTHPNPRVGAVVVDRSGLVIGEGGHLGVGDDHAEVVALRAAGRAA
ncbi:MAG: hypothetical protein ACC658_03755, partial [Acidimicrobiia bacterium]